VSVKIPAIVASALLAGTIGIGAQSANAATAHIFPVVTSGNVGAAAVNVAFRDGEDCRYMAAVAVFAGAPGSPASPVWRSRGFVFNGCSTETVYEDGSALEHVTAKFPIGGLPHGRNFVSVAIGTRKWGGAWSFHRFLRAFWVA
jgi:hypothetical protein